jgi:hypothetical protein
MYPRDKTYKCFREVKRGVLLRARNQEIGYERKMYKHIYDAHIVDENIIRSGEMKKERFQLLGKGSLGEY